MKFHTSLFLLKKAGILFVIAGMAMTGCEKNVEVSAPPTSPSSATMYTSDGLAASVLTGIYMKMAQNSFAQGNQGISLYAGLSADELQTYPAGGASFVSVYQNKIPSTFQNFWQQFYTYIYIANAAIEGIEKSKGGMTEPVKKQLTGEAKFMRAFLHFYAVNLYGDVPFITTTDYRQNLSVSRTPQSQVYDQIIADLKDAQNLLSDKFVTPAGGTTSDRVRPNKWTATALLARVYLYTGKWDLAESEATKLIDNKSLFKLGPLASAFLSNNTEAIWQVQPISKQTNTLDGALFIRLISPPTRPSPGSPADLHPAFLSNFETGDQRKVKWMDSVTISGVKYYMPTKYKVKAVTGTDTSKPAAEQQTIFRLAEQYLIRAEARAKLNNIAGARADIDTIRVRAGLAPTTAADQPSLLDAVMHERQVELFTEWGHRWFDLKRTNRIDAVMTAFASKKIISGNSNPWNTQMQLFPIPSNEILLNPNLAPQNPGYN